MMKKTSRKRIYHHFSKWEDNKNGMYSPTKKIENPSRVIEANELLKDCDKFYSVMREVISNWKFCSEFNLSNSGCNRKAWLGAVACNYEFATPEYITREAWGLLTEAEQTQANKIAQKIIDFWEKNYFPLECN